MRTWWALLGAVLLATGAAYLPALDGAFLLDDVTLQQHPLVQAPGGQPLSAWLDSGRPAVLATFALNFAAVGLDPRGWHLTNVAIHLGVVALAFLLGRLTLARAGLPRPEGPALAAAALLALHPLQSESVAYLSQRAEALAAGLTVAALLLLLWRDEAPGPRRPLLLGGAVALHALGLLTKPTAATLPALWLLHAALLPAPAPAAGPRAGRGRPADPGPWDRVRRRLPAAAPLLALSLLVAVRGLAGAAGSGHAGFGSPDLSAAGYLATQARAIPTYLRLLLVPVGQCADWVFPLSRSFGEPAVLGGLLLLGGLAAGALWLARWSRGRAGDGAALGRTAAFGALFFLAALAPSSSVVPLRDPLAEHRVYLPALGLFLPLAAAGALAARRLAARRAGLVGGAAAALLLGALGGLTAARAAVWTTPLAFWQEAARCAPGKARVQQNLGHSLLRAGQPAEALAAFERALARAEDLTVEPLDLLTNHLSALLALGRLDEARGRVGQALRAFPDEPEVLGMLSRVEYASGRDGPAVAAARAALARDPEASGPLKYLGLAALRQGDRATALAALRAAGAQHGLDPAIYLALGRLEAEDGNRPAACAAWERATRLPGAAPFLAELRQRLAGCR